MPVRYDKRCDKHDLLAASPLHDTTLQSIIN